MKMRNLRGELVDTELLDIPMTATKAAVRMLGGDPDEVKVYVPVADQALRARSRNRKQAIGAIINRIRNLISEYVDFDGPVRIHFEGMQLDVIENAQCGRYFRIEKKPREVLISGWYDLIDPTMQKTRYGAVHVMTWKRGEWETALFEPPQGVGIPTDFVGFGELYPVRVRV